MIGRWGRKGVGRGFLPSAATLLVLALALAAALGVARLLDEPLGLAVVRLADVLGHVAHQHRALVDGADGAPQRLLDRLGELREQAVGGEGVAGVATVASPPVLLQLEERAVALGAGEDRGRAQLRDARFARVLLHGDFHLNL